MKRTATKKQREHKQQPQYLTPKQFVELLAEYSHDPEYQEHLLRQVVETKEA
ncbi:MAG: hypothetical protein PVG39_00905 [Desulfobacteraceae bacterium]|jgi:hypothetical protein